MITSKELYDLCVEVKRNKIMSKTMQTAGDIYYLRYYCGLADKRADSNKNINDKNINNYAWNGYSGGDNNKEFTNFAGKSNLNSVSNKNG